MNNLEVVDIYDENKFKTGKTLVRRKDILKPINLKKYNEEVYNIFCKMN